MRLRRTGRAGAPEGSAADVDAVFEIQAGDLSGLFNAPGWLRDLGILSWLLVGVAGLLIGVVWLLGLTSTIVVPVILGSLIGAVAGPLVGAMQRRGVPRAGGAAIVMLLVVLGAVGVLLMVLAGLVTQSSSISSAMTKALVEVEGWLEDLGITTGSVKSDLEKTVPEAGGALIGGVVGGIKELSSLAVLVTFAAFSAFFILKDGPSMRDWVNRHMGVPEPVATIVTGNTVRALRGYFFGVTIVAVFNAVVIGLGALVIGVPLAGTIAVVTFVGAYVPFLGAWVAGVFAVGLALAGGGTTDALWMSVIVLLGNGILQQIVQPIAWGATLGLHPLVVLVVTIGGGALFGMVGLIIGAPLTSAAVRISQDLAAARGREDEGEAAAAPSRAGPAPAGAT